LTHTVDCGILCFCANCTMVGSTNAIVCSIIGFELDLDCFHADQLAVASACLPALPLLDAVDRCLACDAGFRVALENMRNAMS